jgi:hypothetical protein
MRSEHRIKKLEAGLRHGQPPSAEEIQSIFEIFTWLGEPVSTPAEAWQLYRGRKGAKS